ncbi:MAG: tyrosine-type recombinase/integrase [Firmicutes bacterium]|nr:tyrosine-type recombinase/integrase [Bacillota bacterium]
MKLNSRIIEKKIGSKVYVGIVIDYAEGVKRKQAWRNSGLTLAEYHRGGKRRVEDMQKAFIDEFSAELSKRRGLNVDYANLTVMQLLQKYVDHRRTEKKLTDLVYYIYTTSHPDKMREFLRMRGREDMKLTDFTEFDAEAFVDYLRKLKTREGKPFTDCTIKKILCFYKPAFKYAKRKKFVAHNAFENIDSPKVNQRRAEFFSKDEMRQLWEALENEGACLPIQFAMWTGMRRSEIVGLKWSAINFDNRTIRVREKVLPIAGEGLKAYTELKSDSSERTIPLSMQSQHILFRQIELTAENNKAIFYNHNYSDYVFVDKMGKMIKPDRLSNTVTRLCRRLGIKGHLHKFRHSFASHLLKQGANMKTIQELLGHVDCTVTMKYYLSVDDEDKQTAVASLDGHFDFASPPSRLRICN